MIFQRIGTMILYEFFYIFQRASNEYMSTKYISTLNGAPGCTH
jgi:hypothetical protein